MSKGWEKVFKYAAVFISGLVSGVAVGIATAPKSGKELREDIVNKSHEWQENTKEKFEHLQESSKEQANKVADSIRNSAKRINSRIHAMSNGRDKDPGFIERM